jgi:N-methylhydantoinase B
MARANRTDPISRDVFRHQLAGIAEEMSVSLRRAAFSSIIWHMYDYACALFTPAGDMTAQAETISAQLGIMPTALRHVAQAIPVATWRPGDVIVCNDPYFGCTHTPDIVLFSPVYLEDRLVAITSTIAHHVDIGGKVPCTTAPDNLEVFAEGLILPPLRLVEEGRPSRVVQDIIAANVRDPRACLGDLRAQIAGCRTGERRLAELVAHYGEDRFVDLTDDSLDYVERYMRRTIEEMEDGCCKAEVLTEDGLAMDEPICLRVAVTVAGDEITVDFAGTSEQRDNALNCPYSSTLSMVHYAVKCIVAPDLKQNQGCSRPITVEAPKGSVLNPNRPAAVGSRHFTQQAVADVVLRAMVPLAPERAAAGCQTSFPGLRAGGFDDRPERRIGGTDGARPYYIIADILGGGMGGSARGDGMGAIDTHGGNCPLLSAELMETLSPFRIRQTALVPGSGGIGKHGGGLAMVRDYELLVEKSVVGSYIQQAADDTAPWGAFGGGPGGMALSVLNPGTPEERHLPAKSVAMTLRKGDVLRLASSGGGGWGDPAERDPVLIERDAHEGYV